MQATDWDGMSRRLDQTSSHLQMLRSALEGPERASGPKPASDSGRRGGTADAQAMQIQHPRDELKDAEARAEKLAQGGASGTAVAASDRKTVHSPSRLSKDCLEPADGSAPTVVSTNATVRRLQQRLAQDVEGIFAHADLDSSGDLSYEEWERAFGNDVDKASLKALFEEMDDNADGKVSLQEFKDGLASIPTGEEPDVIKGMLESIQFKELCAYYLIPIVRARMDCGEANCGEVTTDAIREHMLAEDIATAWRTGLGQEVEQRLRERLQMLKDDEGAIAGAVKLNEKYASLSGMFEAQYGGVGEFIGGIMEQVGLPAKDVMKGIENQYCHSAHAKKEITTSNYGGTKTTPEQEYEFVTRPTLNKEYPGGRMGERLEVFLWAAGATRANGERLDQPLSAIADEDMRDSVKSSLLRKAKEALMTEAPLKRFAQHLKETPWAVEGRAEIQDDADTAQTRVESFSVVAGQVRGWGTDEGGSFEIIGTQSKGQVTFEKRRDAAAVETACAAIFESLDVNRDGFLALEEFEGWIRGQVEGLPADQVKPVFDIFDKNHDGRISPAEFLRTVKGNIAKLSSLSSLQPVAFTGTVEKDAGGSRIAGNWEQGIKKGQFRLEMVETVRHHVQVLEELAGKGTEALRKMRKTVTNALKKAREKARVASTGGTSFVAVVQDPEVASVLRREQLEVLVEVARANLMEAGLTEEEVLGLRLYTGPSFSFINGSLRKAAADVAHSNVIHAICSGLTKLSQVAAIPEGRVLYRGMSGRRLPDVFWRADKNGAKGGVERAFLSTSSSWKVAVQYLGDGAMPIIFAIECGAINKGACLSWLSQYPEEDEVLMPPRSYLEVVGPAKQVDVGGGKAVLQIPMRISCNLNTPTIEKSRASRKTQLLSLFDHTLLEIKRDLEALKTDPDVVARAQKDVWCTKSDGERIKDAQGNDRTPTAENSLHNSGIIESIEEECNRWREAVRRRDAAWFNEEAQYKSAVEEATDLKRLALGKVRLWLEDHHIVALTVRGLSMRAADARAHSRKHALLEEARANGRRPSVVTWCASSCFAKHREREARELCRNMGLLVVDVDDRMGRTLLMRQAQSALGAAHAVKLLLDAGENAHAVDGKGWTALAYAAEAGNKEAALVLAHHGGADVNACNGVVVITAAQCGHTDMVTELARLGADVKVVNHDGFTPVFAASENGHTGTVTELARLGADVSIVNKDNFTPSFIASQNGHTGTVTELARLGADVNIANKDGGTPVLVASENGHTDTVTELARLGADVTIANNHGASPVLVASAKGHTGTVTELARLLADVTIANKDGASPVWVAALGGHTGTVTELARLGADVTIAMNDGVAPVLIASANGRTDTVTELARLGADVTIAANNGATPVLSASQNGHTDTVTELARLGADVTTANKDGATPVWMAALNGHTGTVTELARLGADVTIAEKNGATPVFIASQEGRTDTVTELARLDADVNIAMNDGATPVLVASANGHTGTVTELARLLADVNIANKNGNTPVWVAALKGHTGTVTELARLGADITIAEKNGRTPVFVASANGHTGTVTELARLGADVSIADKDNFTPAFIASQFGYTGTVTELARLGADVTIADKDGVTPVLIASQEGHTDTVTELARLGADVTIANNDGNTPVWVAALKGHTGTVTELARLGADVTIAANNGATPVLVASKNGHTGTVTELARLGADVTIANNHGASPVLVASAKGHTGTVTELARLLADVTIANKDGASPVWVAALGGHTGTVTELARLGADVTIADKDGNTPVLIASQEGHTDTVTELARLGADVTIADKDGNTPVLIASQEGHTGTVTELARLGADVTIAMNDGVTSVLIASANGRTDTVTELARLGADVNIANNHGATPVLVASAKGHTGTVTELARLGADVTIANKDGASPVWVAALGGHTGTVTELARLGADVTIADKDGNTPVWIAALKGHTGTVTELARLGADVTIADKDGNTPVLIASQEGHTDTVTELARLGADVNIANNHGATPVLVASAKGHTGTVTELARLLADVTIANKDGASPVWVAALGGHTGTVTELARLGADVTIADKDGNTPVWIAALKGHTGTVTELARLGADVTIADNDGCTSVYVAAQNGHTGTVTELARLGADVNIADKDSTTPVWMAARKGHTDTVTELAGLGAEVTIANKDGGTPVWIAALKGHTGAVTELARLGADVTIAANNGATPVLVASENGHTGTVTELARLGADVTIAMNDGVTPVLIASANGRTDTVTELARLGADVTIAMNDGASPVLVASQNGHTGTVTELARLGADINAIQEKGRSALMGALEGGRADTAAYLLKVLQADACAVTSDGVSCLHVAAGAPMDADSPCGMVELVLEHGGSGCLELRDTVVGWTPMHLAVFVGNESAARSMLDKTGGGGLAQGERLEQLKLDVRAVEEAPLAVFRGLPWHVKLGPPEAGSVEFISYSTVRSKHRCPPGAKGYFEIEIVELDSLAFQLGFVTVASERERGRSIIGVGGDDSSWAVDGVRQQAWHKLEGKAYPCEWKAGDVVGLACDLEAMQVLVSVNGSFDAPNGLVFELDAGAAEGGLFPAMTGNSGSVRCNLGARLFIHAPPTPDFRPFERFDCVDAQNEDET